MAELLCQRSLWGFGAVLAWLVLFHLLVNLWLLCLFTSLLVVLGSWMGSQAILESSSVIHLERFITLEQVPASEEDEQQLDQEIQDTVRKIIRDFVSSWYSTVSIERGFELEVQTAMISMAMELKERARQVDRKALTKRILDLVGCHLQDFLRVKQLMSEQQKPLSVNSLPDADQLWRLYSSFCGPHPAMSSPVLEVHYTRAVVDLLLHVLVPSPHLETPSGRFVVGELITCNVLCPVIAKLSDPDWLNLLIVDVFTKSSNLQDSAAAETQASLEPPPPPPAEPELPPPQEARASLDVSACCVTQTAETQSAAAECVSDDPVDSDEPDSSLNNAEEEEATPPFLKRYMKAGTNPFYQENDSDLDSPLADYKQGSTDSLLLIGQEEALYDQQKESSNGVDSEDGGSCPSVLVNSEPVPLDVLRSSSLQELEKEEPSSACNPGREPHDLSVGGPLCSSSARPSFSFEALSSPDGPVLIQNLRITGTITAKEHRGTGSHPYTLYTIKYETAMGCENPASLQPACESTDAHTGSESPVSIQPVAYHTVNRRYSEFLNLQTRLEEKPELRKLSKGVKGPKKIFPDMPFGNMDSEKIEARRGLLETFLKSLCAIPEVANSEEMQEFLALNTDARIAFVKKPFIVSRIDKIVVNAIVDTLKTAFPRAEAQSPTEESEAETDGGKMNADRKSKSRLKFSSKNFPSLNGSDPRPPVLFSLEQSSPVFIGRSLEELKAFITEQESQADRAEPCREEEAPGFRGTSPEPGERRSKVRWLQRNESRAR
ncbi:sorting nexin-19-like isoform X2 [Genypterus blacodes]|uniref:sorting nexin-19-like isoform X2 n=1 Tax=Genypterus blacodes TaxID=154954 RepID=UPI003F767E7E